MLGAMSKAFTRETDGDDDDDETAAAAPLPAGSRNYVTPQGYARLRGELLDADGRGAPEGRGDRALGRQQW
jgi:transcription elongation factor GreB